MTNAVTSYDYDPLNRLTKITDALAGITQYGYDAAGNTVSKGGNHLRLRRQGRLTAAAAVTCGVNGLGQRMTKAGTPIAIGRNVYAYVGGNPVGFTDPFGLDRTIWSPGPGRTFLDGPRNGMWGGGKWSGDVSGGGRGTAPPLDSKRRLRTAHAEMPKI